MEQTTTPSATTTVLRDISNQMADAVERVASVVVLVHGRDRQPASGLVYAPDLVLTADHVIEREQQLSIQTADQRELAAHFVGRDRATDLAVLRVADMQASAALASEERVRVGQLVMVVGRTDVEGPMASSGVVSSVGGPLHGERGTLERYIRTDAIPYPGFSGGPLIDMQGKVIGIVTTGLVNGLALAIPIDIAITIAGTLAKQGFIKRGYLGISSQLIELPATQRGGRKNEHGLLIVKVDDGSPAQQGGMLIGDILLALDGHELQDAEDLRLALSGERVGKNIPVDVARGNTLVTLHITVGQRS